MSARCQASRGATYRMRGPLRAAFTASLRHSSEQKLSVACQTTAKYSISARHLGHVPALLCLCCSQPSISAPSSWSHCRFCRQQLSMPTVSVLSVCSELAPYKHVQVVFPGANRSSTDNIIVYSMQTWYLHSTVCARASNRSSTRHLALHLRDDQRWWQ